MNNFDLKGHNFRHFIRFHNGLPKELFTSVESISFKVPLIKILGSLKVSHTAKTFLSVANYLRSETCVFT